MIMFFFLKKNRKKLLRLKQIKAYLNDTQKKGVKLRTYLFLFRGGKPQFKDIPL